MLPYVRTRVVIASVFIFAFAMALALTSSASPAEGKACSGQASSLGLERAHAHNDYEHNRPLFDALDHGFKSVEADIWLVDGELIIAHDPEDVPQAVQEGRTLESLYLEPLRQTIEQNGGSVYPGDPDYFTLLIDIKSEAEPTYLALHEVLQEYSDIFTTFGPDGVQDGRLSDLGVATDQTFVPLISDNFTNHFTWTGEGPMPEEEREKLIAIVETAHANDQRVRFWATPEGPRKAREAVWAELLAAGVDYINTDNLKALERFLQCYDPNPTEPNVSWSG